MHGPTRSVHRRGEFRNGPPDLRPRGCIENSQCATHDSVLERDLDWTTTSMAPFLDPRRVAQHLPSLGQEDGQTIHVHEVEILNSLFCSAYIIFGMRNIEVASQYDGL